MPASACATNFPAVIMMKIIMRMPNLQLAMLRITGSKRIYGALLKRSLQYLCPGRIYSAFVKAEFAVPLSRQNLQSFVDVGFTMLFRR